MLRLPRRLPFLLISCFMLQREIVVADTANKAELCELEYRVEVSITVQTAQQHVTDDDPIDAITHILPGAPISAALFDALISNERIQAVYVQIVNASITEIDGSSMIQLQETLDVSLNVTYSCENAQNVVECLQNSVGEPGAHLSGIFRNLSMICASSHNASMPCSVVISKLERMGGQDVPSADGSLDTLIVLPCLIGGVCAIAGMITAYAIVHKRRKRKAQRLHAVDVNIRGNVQHGDVGLEHFVPSVKAAKTTPSRKLTDQILRRWRTEKPVDTTNIVMLSLPGNTSTLCTPNPARSSVDLSSGVVIADSPLHPQGVGMIRLPAPPPMHNERLPTHAVHPEGVGMIRLPPPPPMHNERLAALLQAARNNAITHLYPPPPSQLQ